MGDFSPLDEDISDSKEVEFMRTTISNDQGQ